MPNLEKALEALGKRNLKLNLSQDGVELLELRANNKNIDLEIKNRDGFKKLLKELRK
jgi:hypothetical protein